MSRRLLAAMAILATCASPSLYGQTAGRPPEARPLKGDDLANARLAAAKYAVANGVDLPAGDLAVGFEMGFERYGFAQHLTATPELQRKPQRLRRQ
jgi:hypothetical protein